MSQYFPKSCEPFGGAINVKVDLSNHATKANIKNISHVNTSSFALNSSLTSLKTEVDKLDIGKLVPVPDELSKLGDKVKNEAVKKAVYNKLVEKVNNINTRGFVLKTQTCMTQTKQSLKRKIPDTSELVKRLDYNAKITEIENKILSISGLVINAALTVIESKVPNVSSLVKKQIITQTLMKLKINLLTIIMTNILLLQNLVSFQ